MIILSDIDNCISDDMWRYKLIDWNKPQGRERYDNYHCAAGGDVFRNADILLPGATVFFLTGMPEEYRYVRERWLQRHKILYERILFRGTNHDVNSIDLKRGMIHKLRAEGVPLDQCIAAYDDRRAVVQMFIEEGLPGIHLQIHEQEHLQHVV